MTLESIIAVLVHLPYLLAAVVFVNRYLVGAMVRLSRTNPLRVTTWPQVTVLIPCFNEGDTIYATVRSLASMDYPQERLTIHVLDDASGVRTRAALRRALADIPNLIVTFHGSNRGKRLNLIDGVRQAQTDFIVSMDSDVVVEREALKELLRQMHLGIAAVGGVVRVSNPDVNLLTRILAIKFFIGYEFLKGLENQFGHVMCLSGCLTLFRREVLLEVEQDLLGRNFLGCDVKYGEDRYLTRKIIEHGHQTRLCQTAICFTKVPETFGSWFSQQLRWRRSNIVDFLGGWWHAHLLPLPVAVHYTCLGALLFLFPVTVIYHLMSGQTILLLIAHGGAAALIAALYTARSVLGGRGLPNINPMPFLALPVLLTVSYLMLTPLAILTLVTVNWETRASEPVGT